jgi:thioesterase domain-containing protein
MHWKMRGSVFSSARRRGSRPLSNTVAKPAAPKENERGLAALFGRIARGTNTVILPINDASQAGDESAPAFYCIHSLSGAGGTDFIHLAERMPDVRFFGIQAPPAKFEDTSFGSSVESLAEFYADALTRFQPKGRFFLGGWSAGVIIGLEVAQRLRARGRVVSLFAAIDAIPENTGLGLPSWHPVYAGEWALNSVSWVLNDVVFSKGSLRALLKRGVARAKLQVRPNWRGTKEGGADTLDAFMDVSRYPAVEKAFMTRLYAALFAYKPKIYAGTVVAYEATKKPLLRLPQVGRVWRSLAPRSTVVKLKGTHLSVLKPGDVGPLARDLEARIAAIWDQIPAGQVEREDIVLAAEDEALTRQSA